MSGFFEQLKRRKVIRALLAYAIVAWVLMQVAETTFEHVGLPPWTVTLVIVFAALGFPVVAVLSWIFDVTPGGVVKASDPVSEPAPAAAPERTASVAVLPFADMSPEGDSEYFADGLTEELMNVLARAGGVRVASRTSSFAFKGKAADLRTVADKLKVSHVVEGSVRKSGNRLRITGQLVETATDSHLWSDTFDRELEDIFAVQDEIAGQIADALRVRLAPRELTCPTTEDVRAYDFYLRGLSDFRAFGRKNVQHAIEMYQQAVETDPGFSRAWAAIAIAKATLANIFMANRDERAKTVQEALEAANRSAELAPDAAETHLALGMAELVDGRAEEAEEEFKQAIAADPHLHETYYQYARAAYMQGRFEDAAELFERSMQADPGDYRSPILLLNVYEQLGWDEKLSRMIHVATSLVEKHIEKHPDDARALALATGPMLRAGKRDKADLYAERARALDADNESTCYNVACYYARSGQADKSLDLLERCIHARHWVQYDSDLDSLRDLPRFKKYFASLR